MPRPAMARMTKVKRIVLIVENRLIDRKLKAWEDVFENQAGRNREILYFSGSSMIPKASKRMTILVVYDIPWSTDQPPHGVGHNLKSTTPNKNSRKLAAKEINRNSAIARKRLCSMSALGVLKPWVWESDRGLRPITAKSKQTHQGIWRALKSITLINAQVRERTLWWF